MQAQAKNALFIMGREISILSTMSLLLFWVAFAFAIKQMFFESMTAIDEALFVMSAFGSMGVYYLGRAYYNPTRMSGKQENLEIKYKDCPINIQQLKWYVLMFMALCVLKVIANHNEESGWAGILMFGTFGIFFLTHSINFVIQRGLILSDKAKEERALFAKKGKNESV